VDDLVEVKIVHAPSDAHGPVHEQGWMYLPACSQHLIQLSLGTVLHDDTVARSLGTNTSVERRDIKTEHIRVDTMPMMRKYERL